MAIIKEVTSDKIEIVGEYKAIQCRELITVKEDGVVISTSHHRHVLHPSTYKQDIDENLDSLGTYSHVDTDISGEPQEVQDICNLVWTNEVKEAWKTLQEEQLALNNPE